MKDGDVTIECKLTLKERLRILFANRLVIKIDLLTDSYGVLKTECKVSTYRLKRLLWKNKKKGR